MDLEFTPQGTLVEKLRAGGIRIPAFFDSAGVGKVLAQGKEVREPGGKSYAL